jgi:hypothetical protein
MPLSPAALSAVLAQETDKAFLPLLTIDHPDLADPIRVVCDGQQCVSNGDTYLAFPFNIDFPPADPDSPPQVRLVIDNVDQKIIVGLRTLSSAPTVTLQVVMSDTPDTIEAGPFEMTLRQAVYDSLTIEGTLNFEDILNEAYPGDSYTPANFPGLF